MKIPYNRIRVFSTAELPGVVCDPILKFEFIANPSFELVRDVSLWMTKSDWNETKRIGSELIKAVILPDGSKEKLGTIETIQELADETEETFIANVINGWNVRVSLERVTEVKKNQLLSALSSETNSAKMPVLE